MKFTDKFTNRRLILSLVVVFSLTVGIVSAAIAMPVHAATATGLLRFVHAVPGASAVDVQVDGVIAVPGLDYATGTRYLNVTAADHAITLSAEGKTVFSGKVTVAADQAQTLVFEGTPIAIELGAFEDDLSPVKPGNTRLSAIDAIRGGPAMDLLRGDGGPLVQGFKYGEAFGGVDLPAFASDLLIVAAGGDPSGALIKADRLSLAAGTFNTVVALGTLQGSEKPAYVLLTAAVQASSPDKSASLRFVNAAGSGSAVDIYVGDKLIVPGLAAGAATAHIPVDNASLVVSVRDAGAQATDKPKATLTLPTRDTNPAFTIVVSSLSDDPTTLTVLAAPDNISPLKPGVARLNVINAAGLSKAGTAPQKPTVKINGAAPLASNPSSPDFEVTAGTYNVTISVTSPALELQGNLILSGGVLYNIVVTEADNTGKLIVAATGLNEQPGSTPTAPVQASSNAQDPTAMPAATGAPVQPTAPPAPTQVAVQPTTAPTAVPPTAVPPTAVPPTPAPPTAVAQDATATEPPPPTAAPTGAPTGITAEVNTDQGVNLKIKEYPSTTAKTLALAPSGTVFSVTGVRGPAVKPDAPTSTPGPTPTVNATGVTMDKIWIFVVWTIEADGGTVTGWVNALYVNISVNGKPVTSIPDILSMKQIPENTFGVINSTGVTPVAPDDNRIHGTINVDEGANANLRRTPDVTGEVLTRIPAKGDIIVYERTDVPPKQTGVGVPSNPTWLFSEYDTGDGAFFGWVNLQYVDLVRNGRKVDISQVPVATEIKRGYVQGNASAPTVPPAPGMVATVDKLDPGVNINLRRDPTADAEVLDKIPSGAQVEVEGRNGDGNWLKVKYNDKEGWINSQYVTVRLKGKTIKLADIKIVNGDKDIIGVVTPGPSPTPTLQP